MEAKLVHITTVGNEITIRGANLHVVNGTGATTSANSLGNVIIGYNEPRTDSQATDYGADERSGSHMLVVGVGLNYTKFGGVVVGLANTASGKYSSVSGGQGNTASATFSSVSGGALNQAIYGSSSVSGGLNNTVSGDYSSVSGGSGNTASGNYDWTAGDLFVSDD